MGILFWTSLEDALSSKNFINGKFSRYSKPNSSIGFYYNYGGELDYWRNLCKKYIKFSRHIKERLDREKIKFINKRVLGVSLRGTDYTAYKPINHSIQPDVEEVIKKVCNVLKTEKFDAIYLSTEDKNILARFKEVFDKILILPEQNYIDYDKNSKKVISEYSLNRNKDKFLQGLEYLSSKLLLCECNGLITSMSGGAICAMLFSEKFEYLYVFDLGYYA